MTEQCLLHHRVTGHVSTCPLYSTDCAHGHAFACMCLYTGSLGEICLTRHLPRFFHLCSWPSTISMHASCDKTDQPQSPIPLSNSYTSNPSCSKTGIETGQSFLSLFPHLYMTSDPSEQALFKKQQICLQSSPPSLKWLSTIPCAFCENLVSSTVLLPILTRVDQCPLTEIITSFASKKMQYLISSVLGKCLVLWLVQYLL
jgi:hypothetical protein